MLGSLPKGVFTSLIRGMITRVRSIVIEQQFSKPRPLHEDLSIVLIAPKNARQLKANTRPRSTWLLLLDKYWLRRPELVKRAERLVQNSVIRAPHTAQRPEVHGCFDL